MPSNSNLILQAPNKRICKSNYYFSNIRIFLYLIIGFSIIFINIAKASEFEEFLKSAQNGNAEAQYNVAYMYMVGDGINKNIHEAINGIKKLLSKDMLLLNIILE